MSRFRWVLPAACLLAAVSLAAGCDVRPLRQDQLTGEGRPGPARPDADASGADAAADRAADGAGDVPAARPSCPGTPCEAFESCDPTTMACVLRTGAGMLSGSITDACTGRGINARIGIAGRRLCSDDGKGSYYFSSLPEGNLVLVAFKEGYRHFEAVVSINAGGTVHSIVLQPDTPRGCAEPLPADVACVCDIPGCP